ncbi:hypothetical protein GDO81_011207 [Engystomops pustulosus]|uniref:Uncharacterized protein n=1 Tax=Engystomops pustulosus TaxID=76066 RepID=A0AAV7BCR3_ENGPU|nr:hypothetical protein GDO81_011207 [Engystomops pustulosus]
MSPGEEGRCLLCHHPLCWVSGRTDKVTVAIFLGKVFGTPPPSPSSQRNPVRCSASRGSWHPAWWLDAIMRAPGPIDLQGLRSR